MDSQLKGFYKLNIAERRKALGLNEEKSKVLDESLDLETANRMIENVIGLHSLPVGIATNFKINGKDYIIPMAVEEPSVIAGASKAAKIARQSGGFTAEATDPVMIAQIQIVDSPDTEEAYKKIIKEKERLTDKANELNQDMVSRGGGMRGLECRVIQTERGEMIIVHLLIDCRDAMGANSVNTVAEAIAPDLEDLTGGKVRLRIISNLAVHRRAKAKAIFKKELIGEDAVEGILDAYAFAKADPYRCATNNKGVMNGIDAVAVATGNDWRAVEAGAHAWAARNNGYEPLCIYSKNKDGDIVGEIELPLTVATVGGATWTHPNAKLALEMLGVKTAQELSMVMASVGLAQNFAALLALSTEGINRGHMKLHAKNLAVMAGAKGDEIDAIYDYFAKSDERVTMESVRAALEKIRNK
jgi:hydroxymethylglutaryl-CoA reductase